MQMLRFLQRAQEIRITIDSDTSGKSRSNDNFTRLSAYCDSDWAGDIVTRSSRQRYIIPLHGGLLSWSLVKQRRVAVSSTEKEYVTLA